MLSPLCSGEDYTCHRHVNIHYFISTFNHFIAGPRSDHTTGRGFYLYVEGSSPRVKGHQANLNFKFPHPTCGEFEMYYHMYGGHIGQLSVESYDQQGNTIHIWKRGLTSSDQWKLCFTNISSPSVMVGLQCRCTQLSKNLSACLWVSPARQRST